MPLELILPPSRSDALSFLESDEPALSWPVAVLDVEHEDAWETLADRLTRGFGVLVLCHDEAQLTEALTRGATEVVSWPVSRAHLEARLSRTAQLARVPWLERLAELATDSVEFTDVEAALRDVNPAFERITGYPRAEVLGKMVGGLFRPEGVDPSFYEAIGRGLAESGIWRGQLAARRQDGSLAFQRATIAEVRAGTDQVVGHIAIKRDPARDDLAEAADADAELRLQSLLDLAAEAFVVHSPSGRIVEANEAACRMLSMDRAALLDAVMADIDLDEDLEGRWARLDETPETVVTRWRTGDGTELPVELGTGRATIAGAPFVFVIARDITARAAAEDELRRLNESLEAKVGRRTRDLRATSARQSAVIDNLADGLVGVDPEGLIQVVNPALREMFGLGSRDVTGEGVARLHDSLGELVAAVGASRDQVRQELSLPGERTIEATASPIVVEHEDETQFRGSVLLLRDVTLAREVDRMKTEFIATVSHELRTPLTSVLGFAKLARNKLEQVEPHVDPEAKKARRGLRQARENLSIIVTEGQRLAALINDVLDISKMEAGRMEWDTDAFEPKDIVDHALHVTASLFEDSVVETAVEVEAGLPELLADRDRFIQVMINLISNAVKFTDEGTITVGVRSVEDGIEFSVTDTGAGIPEEDHARVFERFGQSKQETASGKAKGTGLGLPICKHIVEHHGGRIWVESAPGKGSRFAFVVPRPQPSKRPAPETTEAQLRRLLERVDAAVPRPTHRASDILVVDDDPSVRALLTEVLEEAGHRVRQAGDGIQAVDEVRSRRPDLLILDVLMPGLTGFDVAALLRADPATEALPILVLSVLTDAERGVRVGVDRYLTKPIDGKLLLDTVATLLDTSRTNRRVLIVDSDEVHAESIRTTLERDGSLVVGTCGPEDALPRSREEMPDLVVVAQASPGLVTAFRDDPNLQNIAVLALVG